MTNKEIIQSQLEKDVNFNFDLFNSDDLNRIVNYLNEINNTGFIHTISKVSKDNDKFEIELKTGRVFFNI